MLLSVAVERQDAVRVLLVEDNPGDVRLFRFALERCPVSVDLSVAEDGERAWQLIVDGQCPQLLVLDLNLPKMDGLGVADAFARAREY